MDDKIIRFEDGMPGFEDVKEYLLFLNEDEENPFHRLQSVNDESVSFLVVSPFRILPEYEFKLPNSVKENLKIESKEDITIFSIVKVPEEIKDMTVNLAAPIVINVKDRLGKQVILNDTEYSIRHKVVGDDEC